MKKKSSDINVKTEKQPKYDSLDVIFQFQLKMLLDTIECLERFFEAFGAPRRHTDNTIHLAYKFRLSPDDGQREFLAKHIGCARFVYNHYLVQRRQHYSATHKSLKYETQAADLTLLKKQAGYAWLREVNAQSLQQALRNLDEAYKNFYAKRARCPKLHSKESTNSFTVPQSARIEKGLLWLPKFKSGIPVILHREIKGRIGKVTISRTPSGDYYASFTVTREREELAPTFRAVGVDLGIKTLAVTSDGEYYGNPKYLRKYAKKLARAQKCLARKKKEKVIENGKVVVKVSKGYLRQRIKVAKIHQKIRNCRMDYLHKKALDLVRKYDIICIENLNIRGMIRNRKLAKAIADASWGTFVTILKYKAQWNGRRVVQIPRFAPSSQTCSNCGYINKEVKDLKIRKWFCPKCGRLHDRDHNASLVIKALGLKMLCGQDEKQESSSPT